MLANHGVTCLRMMLEYAETEHRYLEQPAGTFHRPMVQFWDDLFLLCERYGLRILLTPFDTFWMWQRWNHHPYNRNNGGPCAGPCELLTCPETRRAIKARLAFAIQRWGGSGALFAWDLWNEIHPSQAGNSAEVFDTFIQDLSTYVKEKECKLYGRAHPVTVSMFHPHILLDKRLIPEAIFRHPRLDFASTHFYDEGTIDDPKNTIDPAIAAGRLVRDALQQVSDHRPFFDSEHGPIHTYKDHLKTLPEDFDAEYFRHFQWAHFASGAAGGGMRWPNRTPHQLTRGMHLAQRALSRFLPLIHWQSFQRRNCTTEVELSRPDIVPFCCADGSQAILWLLRKDTIGPDGCLNRSAPPVTIDVVLPEFTPAKYRVTTWDTLAGSQTASWECTHIGGKLSWQTLLHTDAAFAVRPV
jgi:mannan endo-1,4-beta-mannosidase